MIDRLELELEPHVLGDAQEHRARSDQRGDLERLEQWLTRVAELQFSGHESHASDDEVFSQAKATRITIRSALIFAEQCRHRTWGKPT